MNNAEKLFSLREGFARSATYARHPFHLGAERMNNVEKLFALRAGFVRGARYAHHWPQNVVTEGARRAAAERTYPNTRPRVLRDVPGLRHRQYMVDGGRLWARDENSEPWRPSTSREAVVALLDLFDNPVELAR